VQITHSKAILANLLVELSWFIIDNFPRFGHRWKARPRKGAAPGSLEFGFHGFLRNPVLKVFHAILLDNCHFLINSCRNASETKAWGSATFTCKPGSLRRNFAWLRTSSSSTTSCFLDSAHVRLAQHPDPCSTLPPSRRSRRSRYHLSETSSILAFNRSWKISLFRDASGLS